MSKNTFLTNESLNKAIYKWLPKNAFVNTFMKWLCFFRRLDYALETSIQHVLQEDERSRKIALVWNDCTMKETNLPTLLTPDLQNFYNTYQFGLFHEMHLGSKLNVHKTVHLNFDFLLSFFIWLSRRRRSAILSRTSVKNASSTPCFVLADVST